MLRHNDNSLCKIRLFPAHHRRHYLACALSAMVIGLSAPAASAQTQTANVAIEAQTLENALIVFSTQTGVGIFARGDQIRHVRVQPVSGAMSAEEALKRMLEGTGLAYELNDDGTYVVMPAPEEARERDKEARSGRIEEVYVSARKREESIQEIPIAITAFTAQDLQASGIRSLKDMEGIVPGLNMGGGGNGVKKDSNPYLRGIGQRETKVTLSPAVGTYIDGIYIARTAGAMLDTVGIERVEVLRGPQGTLFGKNTTGGAISITTMKPSDRFGGSVGINVGNYGRSDAMLSVDIPLVEDKLLSRITLSSKNSEGYFTNIVDNTKWNNDNRVTGIGQLRWLPTDTLMVDLLLERTRVRERPRPQQCQFIRQPGFLTTIAITVGAGYEPNCRASSDLPNDKFISDMTDSNDRSPLGEGRYWVDTTTVGGTVSWDVGDVGVVSDLSFKSITAWRKTEQIADEDLDAVGTDTVPGFRGALASVFLMRTQMDFTETTQFSQEFQISGRSMNDRLFFSTGVYYLGEETPQDDLFVLAGLVTSGPASFGTIGAPYWTVATEPTFERLETDNESLAWFGQIDFDVTASLQLTAGLRYTREERWSRYSKSIVDMSSIVDGVLQSGVDQVLGVAYAYHDTPGYRPIDEWRYMACVSPSGQPGCSGSELSDRNNYVYGAMLGDELSHKGDAWTPMLSLKYNLGEDLLDRFNINNAMFYMTYSEGYQSGGVTAGALDSNVNGTADPIEFENETVKNYEMGLKITALDRRLQANIAAFHMDYTDMQITSSNTKMGIPIPFIENVGNSQIRGVEAEFLLMPTANWRIMLNASYTEAEIKEWDAEYNRLNPGGTAIMESVIIDRSDEPMPRVPRWQAYLLTDYAIPLRDGSTLTPSMALRYTSEIYHGFDRGSYCFTTGGVCARSPFSSTFLPEPADDVYLVPEPGAKDALLSRPTIFVDARLTWLSADEKMEISLWGKNLTNKTDYLVGGIPLVDVSGGTGKIYGDPRTFGLEMNYHFGGG